MCNYTLSEIAQDKLTTITCCDNIVGIINHDRQCDAHNSTTLRQRNKLFTLKIAYILDKYHPEETWINELIDSRLSNVMENDKFKIREEINYWRD